MIKTTAINLDYVEPMMVTWDLGRRCNYDCTYCESTRHNNTSKHKGIDELWETFQFIKSWTSLYNTTRNSDITNINFTGGEPTANPIFWDLLDRIKDEGNYSLSLTTNGAWSPKYADKIKKNISGATVSYHAEAHDSLKEQVINNILHLRDLGIWLQVNVMMHQDYWDECVDVCNLLEKENIKYNPRPIGDGAIKRSGWHMDVDGTLRRTTHEYNEEQQRWYFEQMGIKDLAVQESVKEGRDLGRTCCGRRCTKGKVNDEWQTVKLVDTSFKDWFCMVDHFFLHVDQETGLVYHHQTCQALHSGERGPVGHLDDAEKMLANLEDRLSKPHSPIICPNQRCGCGMCVPKAKYESDYRRIFIQHVS